MRRYRVVILCLVLLLGLVALPGDPDFRLRAGPGRAAEDAVERLGAPAAAERDRAERLLVSLSGDARPVLEEASASPDAEVRRRAASAARKIREAESPLDDRLAAECAALIAGGLRDPGALAPGAPRYEALLAFPGPAARGAALVARRAEFDLVLHRRAVALAVRLGRAEAGPYLASLLARGWPLPSTIVLAGEGLAAFAGPETAADLRAAARGLDPVVKAAALRGLSRAGDATDAGLAREALGDADPAVRVAALALLAAVAPGETAAAACALALDPAPEARRAALDLLGRSGDFAAVTVAEGRLDDADAMVRAAAVRALSALGGAARAVRAGAADPSLAVRRAALEASARLPAADRRAALAAEAAEPDPFLAALRAKMLPP